MNTEATTETTVDAWEVAYEAALAELVAQRTRGNFGNTEVYGAVAKALAAAGVSVEEARQPEVFAAPRDAMETLTERRRIVEAIGPWLND